MESVYDYVSLYLEKKEKKINLYPTYIMTYTRQSRCGSFQTASQILVLQVYKLVSRKAHSLITCQLAGKERKRVAIDASEGHIQSRGDGLR